MIAKAKGNSLQYPYKILRAPTDGNFLILPPSHINEFISLPETVMSPTHVIVDVQVLCIFFTFLITIVNKF